MQKQKGFTLIELMIVMIIMGVLAAIGVSAFISSQKKGRDTTRKGNLRAISGALELYYNDNLQYPLDDGSGGIVGCNGAVGVNPNPPAVLCAGNKVFSNANGTVYMPQLPKDPVSSQNYWYISSTGKQFQMYAHLENNQDAQIITPAPAIGSPSCGTSGACNYGVSSPNTNP